MIFLAVAILLEPAWVYATKQASGFTNLWWSVVTAGLSLLSVFVFSQALKSVDITVAYPLFICGGLASVSLVGVIGFGEGFTAQKALGYCAGLIMALCLIWE